MPAHEPVSLRWSQGRHRFVYDQFDQKKLLASLLPDFEVGQRWPACTNILSPFIISGMLRLANILSNKKRIAANHVDLIIKTLTMEVLSKALDTFNLENHRDANGSHDDSDGDPLDVQSLHAFIDNFQGIPRIEAIAQHFSMSARRLSFLYHKTKGRMLRTHLAETRIKKAECLLLGTDMMIKQVAYACSFSSPASFNGAFVAARGVSPAVFRRRRGF